MSLEDNPDRLFDPSAVADSLRVPIPVHGNLFSGNLAGDHPSTRIGEGSDKDGLRPYEIGEPAKKIDWKATAMNADESLVVREHIADVTPNLYVLTDIFRSRFTVNPGFASEQLLGTSAILAMMRTADADGIPTALIAATDSELYVQYTPSLGRNHIFRTGHDVATLIDPDLPTSKTVTGSKRREGRVERPSKKSGDTLQLADVIDRANRLVTPGSDQLKESIFVVVSDFRDDLDPTQVEGGWAKKLTRLAALGHVVISVELTNEDDFSLPEGDQVLATRGRRSWLGSSSKDKLSQRKRESYKTDTVEQQEIINSVLARLSIGTVRLSTEPGETSGEWLADLKRQLKSIRTR